MKKIFFLFTMALASLSVFAQVYQTDFGSATSGTPASPFQPTPVTINSNLSYGSSGGWTGGTTFFGGVTGGAYVIGTNNGNGSFILTLTVASGYKLDATTISCQMRRTGTGPTSVAMMVNGSSFSVTGAPGNGSFANVSSSGTATNITGTFTIVITTSGGSGSGQNIRLDDFSLSGTITAASAGTSSTDYFRSAASGSWTNNSSWESSADGATNWIAATLTPTSTANTITIRNGHTVNIPANGLSIDQTVIQAGGQLNIDPGVTFTLANGAGEDLSVFGTLINAGGAHTWTGSMMLESGGTYIHNTSSSSTAVYNAATISSTSTWIYRGSSSLGVSTTFSNRTFGHLRLESSSGLLTISPSIGAGNACTVNDFFIGDNIIFNCSGLNEISLFNVGGDLSNNGDIDNSAGYFNANFTGVSKMIGGASVPDFDALKIAAGASYTLATNCNLTYSSSTLTVENTGLLDAVNFQVVGSGAATINGTLRTANTNGIAAAGTLANTGSTVLGATSTIHYNGSSTQLFTSRSDYANVEISGGSNKSLEGNAVLSGMLTLTNGKVIIGANNLTVGTAVSGGSASDYIVTNGTGRLTINNVGATTKTFPVGPSVSLYHPVTIANSGTIDNFSVKVSSADLPCISAPKGVTATWDIAEATTGGSDCAITLDYQGAATGTSYSTLSAKIIHCNGTMKDYSNGSVTGTIASGTGFTSFSPFGVAVDDEGGTLPVIFANVKAAEQGSGVLINWSNLTETGVVDYTIEHSANGNNFVAVGAVNARSNNDGREDYSFLHNNVIAAVNYYRIRSTELTNESKYSIVVRVDRRKGQTIVSVYPNPSSGSDIVMQATDLAKGRYTMTVYAANGQQVSTQTLNHNGGSVTEPVLVPATLKAGVYTLLLQSTDTKITSRFVIR